MSFQVQGNVETVDLATLQRMSYAELAALEDELLLRNELSQAVRIRFTAGRVVLILLGVVLWGLFTTLMFFAMRGLPQDLRGLLSAVAVFVALGLAVWASGRLWAAMGLLPRMCFRYALHYWPVLVVLGGQAYLAFRGLP